MKIAYNFDSATTEITNCSSEEIGLILFALDMLGIHANNPRVQIEAREMHRIISSGESTQKAA